VANLEFFDEPWDQVRDDFAAWWRRDTPRRPLISVTAPRDGADRLPPPPAPPADPKTYWLDARQQLARFEAHCRRTYHGGGAYPNLAPCLGPGSLNLFLGSKPSFEPTTVWYNPCFTDPAKTDLRFLENSPYWTWTLETTRLYLEAARGRFIVAMPDIIEGLDILAALFGTQELLGFLLECPDDIHRLLDQLDDLYWKAFDPLYDMLKDERNGNAFMAFQIWGPGRTLKSQCDFSAMISPDMFAEFVCPHLERQCERADFVIFHLDGPSCIRHLPHLLKIKKLKGIQWIPGAGAVEEDPAARYWWDSVWRPIREAGKNMLALGARSSASAEAFIREFGWTGTYVFHHCPTETEARRLLKASETWK
jgi:5-methyltetrahydrofolate--homocysteine methyltransferase